MKYTNYAFISYKREDERWAKWLQHKLEYYKLPTKICEKNSDQNLKKGIRPIFRDVTDLRSGNLSLQIQQALNVSKFLIVVCSPIAAKSPWVSKEVQYFIDCGRKEQIIPFIIRGTPNAADPKDECYPQEICNLKGPNEILGANINEMGRAAAAIKVVATMFDLKFDELWNRYKRNERRKQLGILGLSVLAVVVAILFIFLYMDRNSAYDSLSQTYKKLETANYSLKVTSDNLAVAYDSIKTTNTQLDLKNKHITRINNELTLTNQLLIDEKNRVIAANNKILSEHANLLSKEAVTLVSDGKIMQAISALKGIDTMYLNDMPYFIPNASDVLCHILSLIYDPQYKCVDAKLVDYLSHASPYGRWYAYIEDGKFFLYDFWAQDTFELEGNDIIENQDYDFQFSKDNKLLYGRGKTMWYCWNLETKKQICAHFINSDEFGITSGVNKNMIYNGDYNIGHEVTSLKEWKDYGVRFMAGYTSDSVAYFAVDENGKENSWDAYYEHERKFTYDFNEIVPEMSYFVDDNNIAISDYVNFNRLIKTFNVNYLSKANDCNSVCFWPSGNELLANGKLFTTRNLPIFTLSMKEEPNNRMSNIIPTTNENDYRSIDYFNDNWKVIDKYDNGILYLKNDSTISRRLGLVGKYTLGNDIKLRYKRGNNVSEFLPFPLYLDLWNIPNLENAYILDNDRILCTSTNGRPQIYDAKTQKFTYIECYLNRKDNYYLSMGTGSAMSICSCISNDRSKYITISECQYLTMFDLDNNAVIFECFIKEPTDVGAIFKMEYNEISHKVLFYTIYQDGDDNVVGKCYSVKIPSFKELLNFVLPYANCISSSYMKPYVIY